MSNPLLGVLDAVPDPAVPGVSFRRATVTSTGPLRLQFDGEETPMAASPATLITVMRGDRVMVAHHGGKNRTSATVVGRIDGSGTMLLDEISLSGNITSGRHVLTVPVQLRRTIRKFTIELIGGTPESSTHNTALSVHINGDTGSNYRDNVTSFGLDGIRTSSGRDSSSAPRTAYLGRYLGHASIDFMTSAYLTYWTGTGWQNAGSSDGGNFISGGRWAGDGLDIRTFTFNTPSSTTWQSGSRAQLWGHR